MNSDTRVSVVVLSCNRRDEIRDTLSELRQQDYRDFEVIVVDNNSQDGTQELIEKEFAEVRLIKLPRNMGIDGRNIGIANARGEILVFSDDDAVFERNWISRAVDKFDAEPLAGALAAKTVNFYTGEICDWIHGKEADTFAEREFETPCFVCCAAAIRKRVLDEVGLFPEEYFWWEEERDLSTRIIDSGYRVLYCPDLVAYHKIRSGEEFRGNRRILYHVTRNAVWYYWKYYPLWVAIIATILKIPYGLRGAIRLHCLRLYFKAFLDALLGMPGILGKRKPVSRETLSKVSSPVMKSLMRI